MVSTNRSAKSPFDALSRRVIWAAFVLTIAAVESSRWLAQPVATAAAVVVTPAENPLAAEFAACDADRDGSLTEAEYLKRAGRERPVLLREFRMFDLDGDRRMSLAEFVTVPVGQSEEQRGTLADPVVVLAETNLARLAKDWKKWDRNGDDVLAPDEFQAAAIPALVPGLEST